MDPFFKAIWPHWAIIAIDNWSEWVDEGGPVQKPGMLAEPGEQDRPRVWCQA